MKMTPMVPPMNLSMPLSLRLDRPRKSNVGGRQRVPCRYAALPPIWGTMMAVTRGRSRRSGRLSPDTGGGPTAGLSPAGRQFWLAAPHPLSYRP